MEFLLIESIRIANIPYTLLLGLIILFWLSVMLGALDIESLDFGEVETDLDLDVDIDADIDVDMDTEIEVHSSAFSSIAGILNLGAVPLSVWMSIFVILAWAISIILNTSLDKIGKDFIHDFFRILGGAFIIVPASAFLTRYAVKPMRKMFKTTKSASKHDFVRDICIITSTKVTPTFGIAEIKKDDVPVIINVRADEKENLAKGDKALILDYDENSDVYNVAQFNYE